MATTIVALVLSLAVLLASVLLWALLLRVGLWWAKVSHVTISRLALATAAVAVFQIVLNVLDRRFAPSSEPAALVWATVVLVAALVVPCLVIAAVFRASLLRGVQA